MPRLSRTLLLTSAHQTLERAEFFMIVECAFEIRKSEVCGEDQKDYTIEAAIVARETHQDGSKHLHCALKLKCPVEMVNENFLAYIRCALPTSHKQLNAQAGRRGQKWAQLCNYVLKEDQDPFLFNVTAADFESALQQAHRKILNHPTWESVLLDAEICTEVAKHLNWASEIWQLGQMKKKTQSWREMCYPLVSFCNAKNENWTLYVQAHLSRLLSPERKFKDPSLYIWGPPNSRKTCGVVSILETMGLLESTYFAPIKMSDWDTYSPATHKVILVDECNFSYWNLQNLNLALQGSPWTVNPKYRRIIHTYDYKPWIFISNYPLGETVQDPTPLGALSARLTRIGIQQDGDLYENCMLSNQDVFDWIVLNNLSNASEDGPDGTGMVLDPFESAL